MGERKKNFKNQEAAAELHNPPPTPVRCVGIYRRVRAKTPTMLSFMKKTVSTGQGGKNFHLRCYDH